jgi:hypothetical protein
VRFSRRRPAVCPLLAARFLAASRPAWPRSAGRPSCWPIRSARRRALCSHLSRWRGRAHWREGKPGEEACDHSGSAASRRRIVSADRPASSSRPGLGGSRAAQLVGSLGRRRELSRWAAMKISRARPAPRGLGAPRSELASRGRRAGDGPDTATTHNRHCRVGQICAPLSRSPAGLSAARHTQASAVASAAAPPPPSSLSESGAALGEDAARRRPRRGRVSSPDDGQLLLAAADPARPIEPENARASADRQLVRGLAGGTRASRRRAPARPASRLRPPPARVESRPLTRPGSRARRPIIARVSASSTGGPTPAAAPVRKSARPGRPGTLRACLFGHNMANERRGVAKHIVVRRRAAAARRRALHRMV